MFEAITNTFDIDGLTGYTASFRQQEGMDMTDNMAAEVLRMRTEGMGIAQIARALNKGHAYVTEVLKTHSAYGQPYYMTDEEKAAVRRLRLEGHSHEVIADSIGRSKAAVLKFLEKAKLNKRRIRPIEVEGDVARITLTRGKVALIDAADVPLVRGRNWFATGADGHPYAAMREEKKVNYLHRFLMSPPEGMVVDHVNGDGLDNRRSNLRVATTRENAANSRRAVNKAGYIGVTRMRSGRFYAAIQIGIGAFDTAEEAARAYDEKAREIFGEFAMTNEKRGGAD